MRKTIVLIFWLIATVGLTYVANEAVELVDRQVLPEGSKIEVLALPEEKTSQMDHYGKSLHLHCGAKRMN